MSTDEVDIVRVTNSVTVEQQVSGVEVEAPGPQGPVGPVGPPSVPLEFVFSAPSMSWVVTHNLGRYPVPVVFIDGDNHAVDADVAYSSANSFTVTFMGPQSGRVEI